MDHVTRDLYFFLQTRIASFSRNYVCRLFWNLITSERKIRLKILSSPLHDDISDTETRIWINRKAF